MSSASNLKVPAWERKFECTQCKTHFKARVPMYYAPPCPKCQDSEFIELIHDAIDYSEPMD